MSEPYLSPLHKMVCTTPTDFWNDSCDEEELKYAISHGAVGATTNPSIVYEVLKKNFASWKSRIQKMLEESPTATEVEITWQVIEALATNGAKLLLPIFEREKGKKGRLSIQTNPQFYRNAEAIVDQAVHFASLAPNMQVKIPVTKAGILAIEEATFRGVSINATVCFTVPQAIAVGEAVERGLRRREAAGLDIETMSPVCTIMMGRLDDFLKVVEKRDKICSTPADTDWAGIACLKKAYSIYKERGYRVRLLGAAYRHHLHWTELIGGPIILTMPYSWQKLFNSSDLEVVPRFDEPVPEEILGRLLRRFVDFRKAYEEDGLKIEEFDSYGATVRTLRTFLESYHQLIAAIRDVMLENPDVKH